MTATVTRPPGRDLCCLACPAARASFAESVPYCPRRAITTALQTDALASGKSCALRLLQLCERGWPTVANQPGVKANDRPVIGKMRRALRLCFARGVSIHDPVHAQHSVGTEALGVVTVRTAVRGVARHAQPRRCSSDWSGLKPANCQRAALSRGRSTGRSPTLVHSRRRAVTSLVNHRRQCQGIRSDQSGLWA